MEKKRPYTKKQFQIISFSILIITIGLCTGILFHSRQETNKNNYVTENFSFYYDKNLLTLTDYMKSAKMMMITTGGGIYAPTGILVGYTEEGKDLDVSQPLMNMKASFSGTVKDESLDISKKNEAYLSYTITENKTTYTITSKALKKDNVILSVVYINAGDLKENEAKAFDRTYKSFRLEK